MMASGDVSQRSFKDIIELCRKYSRSKEKTGKGVRAPKSTGSITRIELGNLLENFKTDILETISAQINSVNIKNKFEDEALAIFCSRKNCPLNEISLCVCTKNHEINDCPSLLGLQAIYKGDGELATQAI